MKTQLLRVLFAGICLFLFVNKSNAQVTITGINDPTNNGVSSGTIAYGTTGVVLYGFNVKNTGTSTTAITKFRFNIGGSPGGKPLDRYFTGLTLYKLTNNNYASPVGKVSVSTTVDASNNTLSITVSSQAIAANASQNYFLVGDFNAILNDLSSVEQVTYADLTNSGNVITGSTSSITGQALTLASPVLTISNYATGIYTGTTVAANNAYNMLGFTLSGTGNTDMHEIIFDINFPQGGETFTSGYISSVQLYDAATNAVASNISVQNQGNKIVIDFANGYQISSARSYYIKVTFVNSFSAHSPTAFNICYNNSSNLSGNVCKTYSGCNINNTYVNPGSGAGCSQTFTPATPAAPTVTTAAITNPASTSATVGGSITSVGYPDVTEYGVVYSTSATTPTISNATKFVIGGAASTATTFSNTLGSLTPGTTYYIRAYATNPTNTGYGAVVTYTPAVAAPSASAVPRCGAGQVNLTATGGTPAGGTYKWYTAATGGTAVATGASYSPSIVATTTFYVTYTVGTTESARTAVTATSNPVVVAPVSNATLSYSFSGDAKDVSGNQNDGNLLNAPTPVADRYGTPNAAYSFNGTNQWISSSKKILDPGPQIFTISMWFKTTTGNGGKLISFSNGLNVTAAGGYDRHLYMTNAGTLIFGIYNNGIKTITSPLSYNDGNWHHVVVTFGTTAGIIMYVDNTSVGTPLAYATGEARDGYWKIGFDNLDGSWPSIPTSKYFAGTIDDVAVYNTELTSSAVTALNDLNQIGTYTSVCAGSPITIYAPPITGAAYTWKDPTGATYVGTNGVFSSAVVGAYTLTVTGAPGSCNTSPISYTPTITTVGGSAFTATSPVTVGSASTVTLTSTYDATSTYAWTFTGGTPSTGTGQGPFSVTWSSAGTKTVSLTVTKGSCSSTTTANVVVNVVGPTVTPPLPLCGAGPVTLTATGASGSGTYNWYIDNTTTTPLYTSTTNTYTPFIGGNTILYVSFTSGTVTTARTSVTITVNPKASSSINSPMLSFPFESGSLTDWSGLANNGTLQGSTLPTKVADRNGLANGAYSFSGTNASPQYISTTTQYDPLIFSYSIWFKTTVAGGKLLGFGGKQTGENGTGINVTHDRNLYMDDFGKLFYGVYGGSTVTINTPLSYNDGLWHHVIVTDGPVNGMCIYVDGDLKVSTPTYTVPQQIAEYWRIGGDGLQNWPSRPSNDFFNGVLDDVAIYNHELTAAEAASNDMNLYLFSAYCANNPLTVTAQSWPGNPTYSWVDNAKPSITGTGNPVTFTQATTTNYTLTTTTTSTNTCTQNTAIVTPTMQTYTWTGLANTTAVGTDNNWTNTSTGIAGQAPKFDGTESIVIPTNSSNIYPVLTAAKSVYTLNIASGAKLDLGGFALSVGCNIFNSGTLTKGTGANFNTSAVTWTGVSPIKAQSFTGNSTAASTDLGNMTLNNTAGSGVITLTTGVLDLYNVLTLTSGSLVVSSPATLTLKSVATQTATVAAIPSVLSITGNVSVERYIEGGTSKRGYRLLTSPVNNGSGVFSVNFLKNSAYVTGTTTTNGGFDLSPNANNPSIYFFRENTLVSNITFSSGNYRGINNIKNAPNYAFDNESGTFTLPTGNGFLFFFRGDRKAADIGTETVASYVPTGTTFTATGTLNSGTITVKNWYDQTQSLLFSGASNTTGKSVSGYNLVGNPYASTINIEKFNRQSTLSNSSIYGNGFPDESGAALTSPLKIWMYNPTTKQYSTYEQKSTAPASVADTTTALKPGISSDGYASNLIASGQAFFIRATNTGQTLTFKEPAKTNAQPPSTITGAILSTPNRPVLASTSKFAAFAAMPNEQIAPASTSTANDGRESLLRFTLIKDTINTDAIVIGLKTDISPVYNGDKDAEDLGGNGAQVSLSAMSSDSVKATIYRSPYPHKVQQVIPLYADATTSGAYQLNLTEVGNLPALYQVWLKDSFTKDSVDIKANKLYNFNIDKGTPASFGKDRFRLILRQDPALGLRLIDFTASKVAVGAKTEWLVANEANYTLFTVQRSIDNGKTWDNISVLKSNGAGDYSFTDINPVNGLNKYRLQLTDVNSDISLSKELPLMYSNTNTNISNNQVMVYPNPATELINLSIKQTKASLNYNVKLTNSSGVLLKNVNITQLYWQNNVSSLVPGTYILQVVDNKTKNLLGIAKFVKL